MPVISPFALCIILISFNPPIRANWELIMKKKTREKSEGKFITDMNQKTVKRAVHVSSTRLLAI